MNTILLLEDEDSLRRGICFKLEKEGYRCIACSSPKEGKQALLSHDVQLILCDIMLGGESGLDFCRYVREERKSNVTFIFLTAMDQEIDIVMGYETGADDYITKPFSLAVLISKINSVFRRLQNKNDAPAIQSGKFVYYPNEMTLLLDGVPTELTKNEYKLLHLFLSHPRQILSKTQILEQLFDADGTFADDNTVAVNIRRLREKIGDNSEQKIIRNVRGMGYVWDLKTEKL